VESSKLFFAIHLTNGSPKQVDDEMRILDVGIRERESNATFITFG